MWVTIETVLGNGRHYIIDMESDGLYKLNPNWTGNILEFKDKICKMIVTDDLLIIRTEDRDFRDGSQSASWIKDNREINNVDAYDHNGNHLWNIGEIIGDIKMQIDAISHITAEQAIDDYGIAVGVNQNDLFSCTAGGYLLIVDGKEQKLLLKKAAAW